MIHHGKLKLANEKSVNLSRKLKNQRGMTGIGIAGILVAVAFAALIAMRLFPIYVEHFSVTSHLDNLATSGETKGKTRDEIWEKLDKIFQIDDVKNVTEENFTVEIHDDGSRTALIEYEVRSPMLGNIDIVAVFSDEVQIN